MSDLHNGSTEPPAPLNQTSSPEDLTRTQRTAAGACPDAARRYDPTHRPKRERLERNPWSAWDLPRVPEPEAADDYPKVIASIDKHRRIVVDPNNLFYVV